VTGSGIYQFAAQAKIALISDEFSRECVDFCRFFASCLGGLVVKHEQKEALLFAPEGTRCLGNSSNWVWKKFYTCMSISKFCLAKEMNECSVGCSPCRPTCLVTVGEDFQSCNPLQHQDVFSKDLLSEFVSTLPLLWDLHIFSLNDLFFVAKSPTEILELKPERWYASEPLDFSVGFAAHRALHCPYPQAFCTFPN